MKVIFAGGGTGGHLFPGLALLEEMRRRVHVDALFVGTAKGIEARVVPNLGERLELLDVLPLKGKSVAARLRGVARLPSSTWAAVQIVRHEQPDLVIGVGGYASGPMLAAARICRVPTALLEQNAKPGITNRIASTFVQRAYLTYAESARYFRDSARVLGNPIRSSFLYEARRETPPSWFVTRGEFHVVVLGGSQGAAALNREVPAQIAAAQKATSAKIYVLHQCGDAMAAGAVSALYAELGVRCTVVPFIDDVAKALRDADIVVSRAGATGLAELSAIGRAAILVPFPGAADDHQTANANSLCTQGAAVLVRQSDLPSRLARELSDFIRHPERIAAMAAASKRAGKPEAARDIVDDLFAWLGTPDRAPNQGSRNTDAQDTGAKPQQSAAISWKRGEFLPAKRARLIPLTVPDTSVAELQVAGSSGASNQSQRLPH